MSSGASLTISSGMIGTGGFTKSGNGTLNIAGGNFVTGTFAMNAGTLKLSGAVPVVPTATTPTLQSLLINGGVLDLNGNSQLLGNMASNNPIAGQSGTITNTAVGTPVNLVVNHAGNANFSGVLTNAPGSPLSYTKQGNVTVTFTNNNTYTGSTTVGAGTLTLKDAGTLTNTSALAVNFGTLTLDNSGNANLENRINDAAPVTSNGGTFTFTGAPTLISYERLGALTLASGQSTFSTTVNSAGGAFLNFASFARNSGTSANFTGTNLGLTFNLNTQSSRIVLEGMSAGFMGGWATVGGTEFAYYVPGVDTTVSPAMSQGVIALGIYTQFAENLWTATDNVKLTANSTLTGSRTINSLNMQSATALTVTNPGALSIVSGGILVNGNPTDSTTQTFQINGGTLTAGLGSAAELYIYTNLNGTARQNALTVTSQITNNGAGVVGLVKSGGATLTLTPTVSNTYTGTTTVNGGTLTFGAAAGLTMVPGDLVLSNGNITFTQVQQIAAGKNVTINGAGTATFVAGQNNLGAVTFNGIGGVAAIQLTGGTVSMTSVSAVNDNLAFTPTIASAVNLAGNNLTVTTSGLSPNDLLISGVISNTGGIAGLIKEGSGSVALNQANAGINGNVLLNNGTIIVDNNTALGTGPITMAAGTTLMSGTGVRTLSNLVTMNGNVTLGGFALNNGIILSGIINLGNVARTITVASPLSTSTFSGGLVGTQVLTKAGLGILSLNGAGMVYAPGVNVTAGTLIVDSSATNFNAPISLASGTQLQFNVASTTPVSYASTVTAASGSTVIFNNTAGGNFGSLASPGIFTINGDAQILKTGATNLSLYGNLNHTGPTTIQGGGLFLIANSTTKLSPFTNSSMVNLAGVNTVFGMDNVGAAAGDTLNFGNAFTKINFLVRDTAIQTTRSQNNTSTSTFTANLTLGGAVTRAAGASGTFAYVNNVTAFSATNDLSSLVYAAGNSRIFVGGSTGVIDQGVYVTFGNMGTAAAPLTHTDFAYRDATGFVRTVAYGVDANTDISAGNTSFSAPGNYKVTGPVTNTATLAAGSAPTTVALVGQAASLTLAGGTSTINGILRTGTGANPATALVNGAPAFSSLISTISGGILSNGGKELVVRADAANDWLSLDSKITGAGGLTKVGTGTLVIGGTQSNDYTGLTVVNGGSTTNTLYLNKTGGATAIGGDLLIGDTVGTATVQLGLANNSTGQNNQIATTSVVSFTGTTASVLNLNGNNQTLAGIQTLTGSTAPVIQNNTGTALYSSVLTINNNNDYSLGVSGIIRDAAASPQYGNLGLVKSGTGRLAIGAFSASGGIDVQGGVLQLLANTTPGQVAIATERSTAGTGFLNVGAGAVLDLNSFDLTVDYLNGTGSIVNNGVAAKTVTIGGYDSTNLSTGAAVVGNWAGNITDVLTPTTNPLLGTVVQKRGHGTQIISAAQGFTGSLFAGGGTLVLDMSNLANPTNIIRNTNALNTAGNLTLKGKSSGVSSQTFANTVLQPGNAEIVINSNGGTSTTLNLGNITRAVGGSVNFSNLNANQVVTVTNNVQTSTTNVPGAGASTVVSIPTAPTVGQQLWIFNGTGGAPEMVTVTAAATGNFTANFANAHSGTYSVWNASASNFILGTHATYNGVDWVIPTSNSLGGLAPFTGYLALPATGGVTSGNYLSTANLTLTGGVVLNSLKLSGAQTLTMAANALTFNTGATTAAGIIFDSTGGAAIINGAAAAGQFVGTTTNSELLIHTNHTTGSGNSLTINAIIGGGTNNFSVLTKTGTDTLVLTGANTFATSLRVQDGTLSVGTIAATASAQPLGTGNVILGSAGNKTGVLSYSGSNVTLDKAIVLSDGGYGAINTSNLSTTALTISHATNVISGAGGLIIRNTGAATNSVVMANVTNNTYLGTTTIEAGAKLSINTAAQPLGAFGTLASGTIINSGGVLDLFDTRTTGNEIIRASGTGIGGTGAITYSGTSDNTSALKYLFLEGNTTIGVTAPGSRQFGFASGGFIKGNGFSLTIDGTGTTVLQNDAIDSLQSLTISASDLVVSNMTVGGNSAQTLVMGAAKEIRLQAANIDRSVTLNVANSQISSATIGADNVINGNVNLPVGTTNFRSQLNSTLTINGNVLAAVPATSSFTRNGGFVALGGTANTFEGGLITSGVGTLKLMPVSGGAVVNPIASANQVTFTAGNNSTTVPTNYQALILDNSRAGGPVSQTFTGALNVASGTTATLLLNNATGNPLELVFSNFTRPAGSDVIVGITGNNSTPGVNNRIDLTSIVGVDQGVFWNGSDYAFRDTTGTAFLRPIAYGVDSGTNSVAAGASTAAFAQTGSTAYSKLSGTVTAQTSANIGSLNMGNGGSLTISAANTLIVETKGLLKSDGGTATITGGTLQLGSGIATGEFTIRTDKAGDSLLINSTLALPTASGNSISKFGQGRLTLAGDNNALVSTFLVGEGVLRLQHSNAAGTIAANTITVGRLAALEVNNGITLANDIVLGGDNPGWQLQNTGALRSITGANVLNGAITGSGASRINADAGTLTINNLQTTGSTTFGGISSTFGAAAGSILVTAASGNVDYTHDGTGTLTFRPSASIAGTSKSLILQGGTTVLDFTNMGTATDVLSATTALQTRGSALQIIGKNGAVTTQNFASVTQTDGIARFSVTPNGATSVTVNFGQYALPVANTFATVNFEPATGVTYTNAAGSPIVQTANITNSILGKNDLTTGAVKGYATVGSDWASASGNNIVALGSYTTLPATGAATNTNYIVTAPTFTVTGATTPNSVKVAATANSVNLTLTGQTLDTNAILLTNTGANTVTLTSGTIGSSNLINYLQIQNAGTGTTTITSALRDNSGTAGAGWAIGGTGTGTGTIAFSGAITLNTNNAGNLYFEGGLPGQVRTITNSGAITFNMQGRFDIGHTGTDNLDFTTTGNVTVGGAIPGTFNVASAAGAYAKYTQNAAATFTSTAPVQFAGNSVGGAAGSAVLAWNSTGAFTVGGNSGAGTFTVFGGAGNFVGTQTAGNFQLNRPGSVALYIGQEGAFGGTASFTQNAAIFAVNGTTIIGGRTGAVGSYTINGASSVATFNQGVILGLQDSAQGTFTQNAGTVTIGTGQNINDNNFLKGNNTVDLVLGYNQTINPGAPATTSGTYSLLGGTLFVNGVTTGLGNGYVAGSNAAAGTFTDAGNTATTTSGGTGTFNLGGGTLRPYDGELVFARGVNVVLSGTNSTINTTDAAGIARTVVMNSSIGQTSAGAAGFNTTGTGVVLLNAANTFTGGLTINNGTVRIGAAGALNSTTPNAVTFGASAPVGTRLQINGINTAVGGLNSNVTPGSPVVENASATAATLTINNAGTSTFNGVIQNGTGGGALSLTKTGLGTQILGGTNTYTGPTSITGGTLTINGSLVAASAVTVEAAGTLSGYGTVNGGTLVNSGGTITALSNGAQSLTLAGGTIFTNLGTINVSNVAGGASAAVLNAGTLTVNGAANSVTINVGAGAAYANGSYYTLVNYSGGSIGGFGNGAFILGTVGGLALGQTSTLDFTVPGTIRLSILGDSLKWTGYDTTAALNSSVWSTSPTVTDWALQSNSAPSAYADGRAVLFDDSVLTAAPGPLSGNTTVDISSGNVSPGAVQFDNSIAATYTLTGTNGIAGSTSLLKTNNGTVNINNANTFTGGVILNGGVIKVGNANALGSTSNVVNFGGAGTLQLNGFSIQVGGLVGDSAGIVENGTAGASTLTVSGGLTTVFAGTLQDGAAGTLALTTAGTGTLVLTGANTFTGTATIGAGTTLRIGNNGTTGSIAANITDTGALAFNRSDSVTYGGTVSGTGTIDMLTGTTILTGTFSNSGLNTIQSGATLQVGNGTINGTIGNMTVASGGLLNFNYNASGTPLYSATVSGAGNVEVSAGLVVLTGTLGQAGTTTIDSGATLRVGNATATGVLNNTVVDNGTLIWNRTGSTTYAGNITGTGSVNVLTGAPLIYTGTNTYTGVTNITSGQTLQLGNATPTGSITGDVTNSGTLNFNRTAPYTYAGAISGTGLVNVNSSFVTLTGTSTYTGNTNIVGATTVLTVGDGANAGTIAEAKGSNAGTFIVNRASGYVLGYNITYNAGTGSVAFANPTAVASNLQINTTSTLLFGTTYGSTNVSSLDLTNGSAQFGGLNVQTNSASSNTVVIPTGRTLTIAGNGSIGVAGLATTPAQPAGFDANLTLTGGGAYVQNLAGGTLVVASHNATPTPAGQGVTATFDLAGLGSVSITGTAASSITIGANSAGTASNTMADVALGRMILSTTGTNTVTTGTLTLGTSPNSGVAGIQGVLTLGNAANNFQVNTLYVGRQKSQTGLAPAIASNLLSFAGTGGTLTLGGVGGGAAKTTLNIGFNDAATTGTVSVGKVDLSGGTFNATLGTVTIGFLTSGASSAGGGQGTLIIGAGTITADNIILAATSTTGTPPAASTTGTLTLTGGTITLATGTGITSGATTAQGIATVNLSGTGVIEMSNSPMTLPNASSALNFTGGVLRNLTTFSVAGSTNFTDAGGSLQRTTAGTTTLGTLAFTGVGTSPEVLAQAGTISVGGSGITSTNSNSAVRVEGGTLDLTTHTIQAGSLYYRSGTISNVAPGGATLNSTANPLLSLRDTNVNFAVALSGGPTGSTAGDVHFENNTGGASGGTISGNVNLGGVNRVFNVDDSAAAAVDLTVSGLVTNGGVTKKGTGVMQLSGAQNYSGATVVNEGTLLVSGTLSGTTSATITGGVNPATLKVAGGANLTTATVDVSTNGYLTGAGTVDSAVTVKNGGTLAPDATATGLTANTGSVTFESGSSFQLSLQNSNAGSNGQPNLSDYSKLTLGTGVSAILDGNIVTNVTGTLNQNDLFTIILGGNGVGSSFFSNTQLYANSTYSFTSGGTQFLINYHFNSANFNQALIDNAGDYNAAFGSNLNGNDVALLVVPEPNALSMLAGGLGLALGLQRFRRRRTA